tara:strand:- start:157 stop:684 length:528 start_codon:yes stop_codon:yes gene_type:complete
MTIAKQLATLAGKLVTRHTWKTEDDVVFDSMLEPAGMLAPFAMSTAPRGWMVCNGASVSRTTYADLFTAIGTTWGSVDGNTFNIPDLRGAFLRGIGTAPVNSDYVGPTNVGDYQDDQIASHYHSGSTAAGYFDVANMTHFMVKDSPTNGGSYRTGSTGDTEARVYNRGVQYCIKF